MQVAWKGCYSLQKKIKTLWVHKQVNSDCQETRPQALEGLFKPHSCATQAPALWAVQTVMFSETITGFTGGGKGNHAGGQI